MESREKQKIFSFEGAPVPEIKWQAPELIERQLGEIFRVADRFAKTERERSDIALRIFESLSKGDLEELSEDLWRRLENTDSYAIQSGDFDTVRELARTNERDLEFHMRRIFTGESVPAPTIVIYDGTAHKIGGNIRLMIARAAGMHPQVVIARLESRDTPEGLPELDLPSFEEVADFYESGARPHADRAAFDQALKELPRGEMSEEQLLLYQKLADMYYGFEHSPTLEEFVAKAHEMKVI